MRNTKGIENAKAKVAAKYGLGSTLVTGHKGAYWEQAMEVYAASRISELEAENKRLREEIENQQIEIVKKDEQLDSHRWIPVTERLPEENIYVLALAKARSIQEPGYNMQVIHSSAIAFGLFSHWQPIPPQPPKEQ